MQFVRLSIPDVVLIEPVVFGDARGFFQESWNEREFATAGIEARFVQDNHSRSVQYTLRGLHYQIQQPQGKLVRVVHGVVFDVAVDARRSSPTFGQWVSAVLSAENHKQLWVPSGFAHGFLVLSESADLLYKVTDFYDQADEVCIRWDDPTLGIDWPIPPGRLPLLSAKDQRGLPLSQVETFP